MFDKLEINNHYIKAERKASIITAALAASSIDGGAPLKVIYDANIIVSMISGYTNLLEIEDAMNLTIGELFDALNVEGVPHKVFSEVGTKGLQSLGFNDASEMRAYAEKAFDDANDYSNSIGAIIAPIATLLAPLGELMQDDKLKAAIEQAIQINENTN